MKIIFISLFIILIVRNNHLYAQNGSLKLYEVDTSIYINAGLAQDGKGLVLLFKNKIIKVHDGYKVWADIVYANLKVKNKSYKNGFDRILFLVNCQENKLKFIQAIYYTAQSKIIQQTIYNSPQWIDNVPNSTGESILKKTCELMHE